MCSTIKKPETRLAKEELSSSKFAYAADRIANALQGAGAVVCKLWLINMNKRIQASGVDAKLVASIHDEYQYEVSKKDVQKFGSITKDAMKDTEQQLQMKCPLDNEWKEGTTWAQTH